MAETFAYETKSLVGKFRDRQGRYEQLRQPYDSRFSDIVDLYEPGLTAWDGTGEGQFNGVTIYDGTPPWALRTMADGWLGNLISHSLRWLKYVFPGRELRENDEINQWLQDTEDHMYSVYRQSELYEALAPYTRAALSVGSPVLMPYLDRETDRIKVTVPHPRENYHGPRDSYQRKFQLTAMEAVQQFMGGRVPDETAAEDLPLSYGILTAWRSGNHAERFDFLRCICRQNDPILQGQPRLFRRAPWMEFVMELAPDMQDSDDTAQPLEVNPYWTKPHIRWDYEINPDEFYARTPAWHAIQDVRSEQEIARQMIEAGQHALRPPMYALAKYRNRYHTQPNGWTYYDNPDEAKTPPQPLTGGINYPLGVDVQERLRQSVKRWFFTDLFRQISQMSEDQKAGWPTATHILELQSEKATLLTPRVGRFTSVLREIDDRMYQIEREAGRTPPEPEILQEYLAYRKIMGDANVRLDIEFIGPLAQMQQRGLALGRVQAGLAIINEHMKLDPTVVGKVRLPVSLEKSLEQVGFPQDAIVPQEEYEQLLLAEAQAAQQQELNAQLAAAADAVPKLSGTVEPGSPLGAMVERAQHA